MNSRFAIVWAMSVALAVGMAMAQDPEVVAPREVEGEREAPRVDAPAVPDVEGDTTPLVDALQGLRFVPAADQVQRAGRDDVTGVEAPDLPLLQSDAFARRMARYLSQPVSERTVNAIRRDVVLYHRQQGRPIVDVYTPEQDITTGVVQFVVVEGQLGEVRAVGNQHTSSDRLTSAIRTEPGQPIATGSLLADLDWINLNPFREVDAVFVPGAEPGQTDLELRTEDRFPLRLYTGYENTGVDVTGEDRLFAGFNWGDAFSLGRDHQLNYQYTTSDDLDKFRAHALSYFVPLPWRHTLSFYGSYAESDAAVTDPFNLEGQAWQTSLRYGIPLQPTPRYRHELTFGFDFKQSNSNLFFGGTEIFDTTTDVVQASVGYQGSLRDAYGATTAGATLFFSPGQLSNRNRRDRFEAARVGADPEYAYVRLTAERATRLPADFLWLIRGEAQLASDNLLASEQLGVGGYRTVRGYPERVANGDRGFWISTEVRTPAVAPLRLAGVTRFDDQLQFLGFYDFGQVSPTDRMPGEADRARLSSTGVGLRYSVDDVLALRYDYGFRLSDRGVAVEDRTGRHHLSVVVSLNF
ncbi:MAG: ShlB/FhaC/HecB family hemolysin secretion/activation protein [Phycisphaeraceae bacterium]